MFVNKELALYLMGEKMWAINFILPHILALWLLNSLAYSILSYTGSAYPLLWRGG